MGEDRKSSYASPPPRVGFIVVYAAHFDIWMLLKSFSVKPDFHIVANDGDASQSVDRLCCWDAYDDMGTFFGDVADVPVVSPTSQSRLEKFNLAQLLIMSSMHCHCSNLRVRLTRGYIVNSILYRRYKTIFGTTFMLFVSVNGSFR